MKTARFTPEMEEPAAEYDRHCVADGCPLASSIGDRCFFHANVAYASTDLVTKYITRPYVETKGEGDYEGAEISIAEALIRNGILHYSEIYFKKYEWKGKTYYPQAIAEREFRQLWSAGLIPDELKGRIKNREDFFDALNRRPGHIIRLDDGTLFCTDWIVDTYRSMLLDAVKKAVARSSNDIEYVPIEKQAEEIQRRIGIFEQLTADLRRAE